MTLEAKSKHDSQTDDLIEQTNSLMTTVSNSTGAPADSLAFKIVECLFERMEPKQVREIVDCAVNRYKTIEKLVHIPVHRNGEIVLLPVNQVISIVASAETLHLTTIENESFTIDFRLKDLELRLSSIKFVRLSRNSLVNLDFVVSFKRVSGGAFLVTLTNHQQITASREQSRILRKRLLRL